MVCVNVSSPLRLFSAVIDEKNAEIKQLREKYEMESEVRQSAESYAARMYGKNKAFQVDMVIFSFRWITRQDAVITHRFEALRQHRDWK